MMSENVISVLLKNFEGEENLELKAKDELLRDEVKNLEFTNEDLTKLKTKNELFREEVKNLKLKNEDLMKGSLNVLKENSLLKERLQKSEAKLSRLLVVAASALGKKDFRQLVADLNEERKDFHTEHTASIQHPCHKFGKDDFPKRRDDTNRQRDPRGSRDYRRCGPASRTSPKPRPATRACLDPWPATRGFPDQRLATRPDPRLATRACPDPRLVTRACPDQCLATRACPDPRLATCARPDPRLATRDCPDPRIATLASPDPLIATRARPDPRLAIRAVSTPRDRQLASGEQNPTFSSEKRLSTRNTEKYERSSSTRTQSRESHDVKTYSQYRTRKTSGSPETLILSKRIDEPSTNVTKNVNVQNFAYKHSPTNFASLVYNYSSESDSDQDCAKLEAHQKKNEFLDSKPCLESNATSSAGKTVQSSISEFTSQRLQEDSKETYESMCSKLNEKQPLDSKQEHKSGKTTELDKNNENVSIRKLETKNNKSKKSTDLQALQNKTREALLAKALNACNEDMNLSSKLTGTSITLSKEEPNHTKTVEANKTQNKKEPTIKSTKTKTIQGKTKEKKQLIVDITQKTNNHQDNKKNMDASKSEEKQVNAKVIKLNKSSENVSTFNVRSPRVNKRNRSKVEKKGLDEISGTSIKTECNGHRGDPDSSQGETVKKRRKLYSHTKDSEYTSETRVTSLNDKHEEAAVVNIEQAALEQTAVRNVHDAKHLQNNESCQIGERTKSVIVHSKFSGDEVCNESMLCDAMDKSTQQTPSKANNRDVKTEEEPISGKNNTKEKETSTKLLQCEVKDSENINEPLQSAQNYTNENKVPQTVVKSWETKYGSYKRSIIYTQSGQSFTHFTITRKRILKLV